MNYYDILGLSRQATPQEIKAAYRKLAMAHHPDRGGDESTFQKISQAYETLNDANKRSAYDNQTGPRFTNENPNFHNFEDINEMFNHMFRGGTAFDFGRGRSGHGRTRAKNLDLNIKCRISLLDSFIGKEVEASYMLPSGRKETVHINIPPGVEEGDIIKFSGMGDDTYPQVARGDLNVSISVAEDLNFHRRNDDVVTVIEIDAIEAMIGCKKPIETIDGRILNVKLKPGMTHGGEYSARGMGFKNLKTNMLGDFVIIVYIRITAIHNENIIRKLEDIKNEIDNLPK